MHVSARLRWFFLLRIHQHPFLWGLAPLFDPVQSVPTTVGKLKSLENFLWQTFIRHSGNMACPECLMNVCQRKFSMEHYKLENAPMVVRRSDIRTPSKTPLKTSAYQQSWEQIAQDRSSGILVTWPVSRPRWLSWMRRPTGDQEVTGSTPAEVGNILSWRLIMKYFLRSFSPFRWFKKGSCQFLAKECAQYWLTA